MLKIRKFNMMRLDEGTSKAKKSKLKIRKVIIIGKFFNLPPLFLTWHQKLNHRNFC